MESKPSKPAVGWTAIRRQLTEWQRPALVALIKDLHDASPENRDFLRARFDAENACGDALENYRRRIVEQFFPSRGMGDLKLGEARKAIRDYVKAAGNITGTMDLLLTFVESGTEFTRRFGGIDAAFYSSLKSAATQLSRLMLAEGRDAWRQFHERIRRVKTLAGDIGWGYGDFIRDLAEALEKELDSE